MAVLFQHEQFHPRNNEKKPHYRRVTVLIIFFIGDNDTDEITNSGFAYATKD